MENIKSKAKELFKGHPAIDTFFMTSDAQGFFIVQDARNHAQGLKDTSVTKVVRDSRATEDASQDLVSKVIYLDKEDVDQIENTDGVETAKVVVIEKTAAEKQAQQELLDMQNGGKEDEDGLPLTDEEKAQIIEAARSTSGNNDADALKDAGKKSDLQKGKEFAKMDAAKEKQKGGKVIAKGSAAK